MKRLALTAGVIAVAVLAGVPVKAADLDYGRVPTDRYSSAYEDPRYRDLYGPERGNAYGYRGALPPVPPAYVYRDNQRSYDEPRESRYRYRGGYSEPRYSENCVPREEAKRRLVDDGWRDFYALELREGMARIKASRPNGDLFDLRIDRCTGEILHSQLLRRGFVPYAYDNRPGRWEKTY